jgi:hypothetical protein
MMKIRSYVLFMVNRANGLRDGLLIYHTYKIDVKAEYCKNLALGNRIFCTI